MKPGQRGNKGTTRKVRPTIQSVTALLWMIVVLATAARTACTMPVDVERAAHCAGPLLTAFDLPSALSAILALQQCLQAHHP